MRKVTPTAVRAIAAAVFGCLYCSGQTPAAGPAFDVASVRMAETGRKVQPDLQVSPGSLNIRNQSLEFCIQWAYDMPPFQTSGPAWLNESRFDIAAKAAGGAGEAEMRLMLRTLLAERLGVKTHLEQKEMQVYLLTLAKGGPKFQESTTEGPPVFDKGGAAVLTAHRVTMKDFAAKITEPLQRPVVDATGLKGRYEIRIDVSSYLSQGAAGGGKGEGGGSQDPDIMSLLFTGLQQQLGVKLEARKESVGILVIDHAEKTPLDN